METIGAPKRIQERVEEWNANSYEYGADLDPATRKEFEEEFGLAEIRKQITEELAASQIESHDAG